ncbi:hypothetical protein SEA_LILPHARAOH_48 [Mycobacterium phage LilPharaoh]|uniref:Uncharacterized protein n=1 Tax=Mycobacterium phage Amelie TaxID=1913035 RepID=A0A1J0GPY3_9CAUD|nr:hypothetical protein AVV01_gp50 [Mycobacterium phage Enkosi]YP_009952566.1 hypothetical protein I5G92_gp48 [Mycobacterium phage Amelie]ATN90501.1 hypothetical protein SEA_LILPHARAOH_48 [Mycobacterium phage LilPharaoh]AVP42625.1 hypothetical protein SEA_SGTBEANSPROUT_48 [Mycobacterium phage SgtBeansprout]AXC37154.1 hypothetical protein SEA_BIGLEBOPS_48 [Mycobacterium phage Biglebops]QGJ93333.1 hypothetical protein PBI_MDAVU_49 [Mycobacterium phage Mdavu]UQS94448.1 hypothetical protein SEA_N
MADVSDLKGQLDLLAHARSEKAKWAEIEKGAKAAIEEALGHDDVGTIDGKVVVRRKEIKSNKFDQSALKKAAPEVFEAFVKTTVSYRMDLVEEEG